jgi:hypothetical protein
MSDTNETIKQRIEAIFPDRDIANRAVTLLARPRPLNTSSRSLYPYYNETYAKWVKKFIDQMIESKSELIFRYSVFCTASTGISQKTLYYRVNCGIRYLVDFMDEDNKYGSWREQTLIHHDAKRGGLRVWFKPECLSESTLNADIVMPHDQMPRWKMRMEEWLESDEKKPFIADNLCLSYEEIRDLRDSLKGLPTILGTVEGKSITLVRVK